MTSVVKCAFCDQRFLLDIEELDNWFSHCECGSNGFVLDEAELVSNGFGGAGFTVQEVTTSFGTRILLADPIPVFVDPLGRKYFVCWYKPMEEHSFVIC